jgi:hypothetical protein
LGIAAHARGDHRGACRRAGDDPDLLPARPRVHAAAQ